jgi:hypothetical protein
VPIVSADDLREINPLCPRGARLTIYMPGATVEQCAIVRAWQARAEHICSQRHSPEPDAGLAVSHDYLELVYCFRTWGSGPCEINVWPSTWRTR